MKLYKRVRTYIQRKVDMVPDYDCPGENWADLTNTMRILEADSKLLADLIQLMIKVSVGFTCDADFKEWGIFDISGDTDFSTGRQSSTPKEAIQAAVVKWKESK